MNGSDIGALMRSAEALVGQAGAIALRYFRTELEVIDKGSVGRFDPVTAADREIEAFLRDGLARAAPEIGVVGEEFGASGPPGGDYCLIDPIDGTRAFMSGMPGWGILLGLVVEGRAVGGVMHQPFTGEFFVADPARGSVWRRGAETRRLRARGRGPLAECVLYCTDPAPLAAAGLADGFARLAAACRLQRWGGDCYAFAMVAAGSVDIAVDAGLAPHDIAALIPIIEGAGGVVGRIDGGDPLAGGDIVAAANAGLFAEARDVLLG